MPPVFGPVSPSPTRLWSWAVPMGKHGYPIGQDEEAGLFAVHEFFDHHFGARPRQRHRRTSRQCRPAPRLQRHGHDHAFAGGQTIGLDHEGRALGAAHSRGRRGIGKAGIAGGRGTAGIADFLGEGFGRLKPCRALPTGQRSTIPPRGWHRQPLRPRGLLARSPRNPRRFLRKTSRPLPPSRMFEIGTFGQHGDARIARCHDQPVAFRVLLDRPGQACSRPPLPRIRMFIAAPFDLLGCSRAGGV